MAFVYRDQENVNNMVQKGKSAHAKPIRPAVAIKPRTALGVLNANHERINFKNTKKPIIYQKNVSCIPNAKSSSTFVVHEDKLEVPSEKGKTTVSVENENTIKETVDEIPRPQIYNDSRFPLKDIEQNSSDENVKKIVEKQFDVLPMSLEKSCSKDVNSVASDKTPVETASDKKPIAVLYDIDIYTTEIMEYLVNLEVQSRPRPNYMVRQPEITYVMRTILVDWLVEVADEYKLQTQTLFLAVSFIDKFLSSMSVVRSKLQLLGTAAMFVASKCEEIYPPEVTEFVYITDDTYTVKQVLRMEYLILKVLEFEVTRPTSAIFVHHFSVICSIPKKVTILAMYLCELVLLECDPYLQFQNSIIASSAIAIARNRLEFSDVWPTTYKELTKYSLAQLVPCIEHLNKTYQSSKYLQQQAVNTKYGTNEYMNVSGLTPVAFDVREYLLQMKELNEVDLELSTAD